MADGTLSRTRRIRDAVFVVSLCTLCIGAFSPLLFPLQDLPRGAQATYWVVLFFVPGFISTVTFLFSVADKPLRYVLAALWTLILALVGIGLAVLFGLI